MALSHQDILEQVGRLKILRDAQKLRPGRAEDYAPLSIGSHDPNTEIFEAAIEKTGASSARASQHATVMAQNEINFRAMVEAQQKLERAKQALKDAKVLSRQRLQAAYKGSQPRFNYEPGKASGKETSAPQWLVDQINAGKAPRGNFGVPNNKSFWYSPKGSYRTQHPGYPWAKWAGDINVPGSGDYGNRVKAFKNGTVTSVKRWGTSYGNHIRIKHPDGTETLYAHLSKIGVKVGQKVSGGQNIGRVGATGKASGPHLHFEIK